jgi:hypothetical protein
MKWHFFDEMGHFAEWADSDTTHRIKTCQDVTEIWVWCTGAEKLLDF